MAGTWIESDALICQKLIGYLEDKRFMFEDNFNDERGQHVFDSVQNVRAYAVNARFLPSSGTSQRAIKEVADACRTYIQTAGSEPDFQTLRVALLALRKRIGTQILALAEKYDLECDLDLGPYRDDGIAILESWMRSEPYAVSP